MVVGVVEVQRKDPALPWPFAYSEQGYPGSREGKLVRAAHKYFALLCPLPLVQVLASLAYLALDYSRFPNQP
jgi:hypothetical protein